MILVDLGAARRSRAFVGQQAVTTATTAISFHVTIFSVTCYFLHTIIAIALRKTDYLSGQT
jgi:hypothetical protein